MLFKKKLKVLLALPVLSTLICCNMMDKVIRKETRINFKNDVLFTGRFKNDTISELLF